MGSRTCTVSRKNTMVKNFAQSYARFEFPSVFCAPSRKLNNTGHSRRISP
ncbi:hypothetical protein B296_00038292 [Ensete ventricosum]|uniref:Uncharacterized protein n=1 Tax=Ensete ventricosum TaxID=4639 RepID=A0A426WYX8_ENSVE|nr:hypothetical protein B296_00038292 [Ensete ventricosum]